MRTPSVLEEDPVPVVSTLALRLRPDAIELAPAVLDEVLRDTRAFDGCLGLEVLQDVTDPARVLVIERWESIEHDDAYRAWRATPEGASRLGEVIAEAPVLTRYEVRSTL